MRPGERCPTCGQAKAGRPLGKDVRHRGLARLYRAGWSKRRLALELGIAVRTLHGWDKRERLSDEAEERVKALGP